MNFPGVTFTGPKLGEAAVPEWVPAPLAGLLLEVNGVVAFEGGLHLRGICDAPSWHSLEAAMDGDRAFHSRYDGVNLGDVPFGQDVVGDQWLLRDGWVIRLAAEIGEIERLEQTLPEFLAAALEDPSAF